jgi:hypothetical protein
MEGSMPLSGFNKLCKQCTEKCKQWEQITVVRCPFFKSNQKGVAKIKKGQPCKHKEMAETELLASKTVKTGKDTLIPSKSNLEPLNAKSKAESRG